MSEPTTVPLQTADFLLGRMITTAQINKELNEKVSELQRRVDLQSQMILSYEHEKDLLETKIKNLKSAIRKGTKK